MDFFWWYLFVGLIFNGLLSFIGAYVAREKGRSGLAFWLLGFLLSFFIALLVAIGIPKVEEKPGVAGRAYSHKKCPECAEQILIEANKCKHCGAKQSVSEDSSEKVRSWCPYCRSESHIPPKSPCPNCGQGTHPWD